MIGTFVNAAGILLGGILGLTRNRALPAASEAFFKVAVGAFITFYGLRLTWLGISGSFYQVLKQILITIIAMMLGRLVGRLLRFQKISNRIGRAARDNMSAAKPDDPNRVSVGFKTCAGLFCAAPLGILGALHEGLVPGYFYPLAIKAVIDGLATRGFVPLFGWGVIVSALPVIAFQGSITALSAHFLAPFLIAHNLLDSVNAVGGLLVFCVALVVLDIKKLQLADYLPSLALAPIITSVWR
jgi:uncharacterized membrane protein YqgA involved in biofilm formation